MATQTYQTPSASRNQFSNALDMLEHAKGAEVLARFGMQKQHPTNKTNTVMFRRLKTWKQKANGAPDVQIQDFAAQEGVTPNANTIAYEDVPVTLKHWVILFKLTSDAELYHEENIPEDMKIQTGETMAELKEKIAWGVVKGGTNVVYANGTSRNAVNSVISLSKLRLCTRRLSAARGKMTTKVLSGSSNFGTSPVTAGWYVFAHTDMEADIRALPGFVDAAEYGSPPSNQYEIGKCERYRFILTPVLDPILSQGAAVGSTGMIAANATNIDIYPVMVMAADSWCNVALRGHNAISPTYFPAGQKSPANPAGMFGWVGGDFRSNAFRANENWQIRLECAASAL